MKKRNDNFLITSEEYKSFVKYFSLISKKNILYIANKKITIFLIDNNISKIDLFLQNLEKNFINLYYLDFICRFFFKNTIIRYKLNLILALHEADYDNFNIILKNSYMVGDRWSDIEAGNKAGCKTIFIDYNYNEEKPLNADYYCRSLYDAVKLIIG